MTANLKYIMKLVAVRTGCLEELDIVVQQHPRPLVLFNRERLDMNIGPEYAGNILGTIADKVVKKNKESLKFVSFSSRLLGPDNANKDVTQGILRAFLNAPALEKLKLTNPGYRPDTRSPYLTDFEEIVRPHRHRHLYVSVFSVPYLK